MKKILLSLLSIAFSLFSFAQSADEQHAMTLFQNGKRAESAVAFEKIIAANPSNSNAMYALGAIYLDLGKNQEAYQLSAKALLINKNDNNLSINKARAAVKIGKTDEAIALMDACITRDISFFMPYYVKGKALDEQNKFQLAIAMYSKAIQLNANFPNAYLDRANDFSLISRYTQAIADYDKVLALAPESNEAYNRRGIANYQLEKYENALFDYNKAIEFGNFDALVNRGVLYKDQEKRDLAKVDFNKAIDLRPKQAGDAYFNLADIFNKEQKYEDALNYIQKAIALEPNDALFQAMYTNILLNLKRDVDGLAAAERILTLDAKNRDGFIYKATALSNLKRYDEAIKTITAGVDEYPDFHLMYSLRGFIYKLMGKTELAATDNAMAKQLGVKN